MRALLLGACLVAACTPGGRRQGVAAALAGSTGGADPSAANTGRPASGYVARRALPSQTVIAGASSVVLERDESWAGSVFVREIRWNGRTLYPVDAKACAAGAVVPAFCEGAFASIGGHEGHATQLVAFHAAAGVVRLVFAAVIEGSSECGAQGFWVLEVAPNGARATRPIEGCFAFVVDPGLESSEHSPRVVWGPPLELSSRTAAGATVRRRLDESSFSWSPP
jgi:hypothetical protein